MKLTQLLSLLALAMTFSISAQKSTIHKIAELAREENRTMEHLDVLCNRIGGRPIGSPAYDHAVEWSMSQFKHWGLNVRKEKAGELRVGFMRGPWFGKLLGEESMTLHFVTPSYTSGTKGAQTGHVVIEPKTQADFERMKHRLKGAWVLVSGESTGWPVDHTPKGDSVRMSLRVKNDSIRKENNELRRRNEEERMPYTPKELKDAPALFYREMVDAGILGIIQSARVPLTALYSRQVAFDPESSFDNLPTIPDIKLDEHQYRKIYQMVKERRNIFLEFDIRNHFKMGLVPYYNVVAEIKGSKYPDEYVVLSAHLDAFDVATGGVDDGSGVSPIMEAARLLQEAGAKPKRTILFCLFAGEEFGLLGAKAWAKANKDKLPKISNLFNRDGGPTVPIGMGAPKSQMKELQDIAQWIESSDSTFRFSITEIAPYAKPEREGGTDASVFAVQGVPTIHLQTADTKGYDFNYREIWHTERDLYNKSIPEYQEKAAVIMAQIALGVANMDKLIQRNEVYK